MNKQKPATTNLERQNKFRQSRIDAGLKEVRNLWANPEDHEQIKKYVERLNKKRLR